MSNPLKKIYHPSRSVAECLRLYRDEVVRVWSKRVLQEISNKFDQQNSILADSVPLFLDQLADALEAGEPSSDELQLTAQSHARHRASLKNYSLQQVQEEYRILWEVLIDELSRNTLFTATERAIILGYFYEGKMAAVDEYMKLLSGREKENEKRLSSALLSSQKMEREIAKLLGELQFERNRFETVLQQLPVGVVMAEAPSGALVIYNDRMSKIMKGPLIHVQNLEEYSAAIQGFRSDGSAIGSHDWPLSRAIESGAVVEQEEVEFALRDGSRVITEVSSAPIFNINHRIVAGVAVIQDITEKRKIEQSLQASEEKFRTLADSMPSIVWASDPDGHVYYCNRQWNEYTGKNCVAYEDTCWHQFIYPNDQKKVIDGWLEAKKKVAVYQVEFRLRRKDGQFFWHLTRAAPIPDQSGKIQRWYGTTTNIDDQKLAEERLTQEVQAREDLLSVVSHDLRNPLGSIIMGAGLLTIHASQCSSHGPNIKKIADTILNAGKRMNSLIEDLLRFAKLESGHFILKQEIVNMVDLICESLDSFQLYANEKSISLQAEVPMKPLLINCDYNQVMRVLANLISNAIKFTPESGRITIYAEEEENYIRVSVSDTGPGIPDEHLPHLFERYWQARKTAHLGTGLGLSICKRIIDAHHGKIGVQSKFGAGSTFFFMLPRDRPPLIEEAKR